MSADMTEPPLYILARNRREARRWADEHGIRPRDWRLMTPAAGRGLCRIRLVRVDGWQDRPDLDGIEETLDIIAATGHAVESVPDGEVP